MTDKELIIKHRQQVYRRVIGCVGYLLNCYEDLKGLPQYRHKIKQYGELFYGQLTLKEEDFLRPQNSTVEAGTLAAEAANYYEVINDAIEIAFSVANLEPQKAIEFADEFQALLNKYGLKISEFS